MRKARIVVSHGFRQLAEQFLVVQALALLLDGLLGQGVVVIAVGRQQVDVFERGIGGQHDVRVKGGVAPEGIVHYGEQVVAHEALARRARIGDAIGRIRTPAEQGLDRRIEVVERIAKLDHVDGAWLAALEQVRALQLAHVHPAHFPAGRHAHAALAAHRAGNRRQQLDGPRHLAAVVVALDAPIHADERLSGAAVEQGQFFDVGGGNAGDRLDVFQRVLGQALVQQFFPADGMTLEEIHIM